jgi:arylsulfatase A-like enzyme
VSRNSLTHSLSALRAQFASDNGGPIGPQASNLPLKGGKDTNLEGGVRTLAALGGGWLPPHASGRTLDSFMHESDWYATLCDLAGVSSDDGGGERGVPRVDSISMWPQWLDELESSAATRPATRPHTRPHMPRTLVLATRDASAALIDVRAGGWAYKLIRSRAMTCECAECRPCLPCNASGGCLFDVLSDPTEAVNLAAARPDLVSELGRKLDAAAAGRWVDRNPINQECWEAPKDDPDHWLEVARARGAVMQPWLRASSRPGGKPRVLYPQLKRKAAPGKKEPGAAIVGQ